jgi:hypothetical protein
MLKNKKIAGLFVILGFLLILAAAKKTFEGQRAMVVEIHKEKESTAVLTENILPEALSRIILYKGDLPDKKIQINKGEKDAWFLESRWGVRAREKAIPDFLKNLSGLQGTVRSMSRDVFSDFKIADNEGLHVVLKNADDKETLHLVIGGIMPRWGAYFARLGASEKVVLVEGGNMFASLGLFRIEDSLDDYSLGDYRLFEADLKRADRLDIILPKKEACAIVKSEGWAFEPPDKRAAVDPARVDEFLRIVSEMRGRDVVDPNGSGYDLEPPQAIVKISWKEGAAAKTVEAQLGGPVAKEGMFYVRVGPGNLVYKVPENAALNLGQNKAYFAKAKEKKK